MNRGRQKRGRARSVSYLTTLKPAKPLLQTTDHGEPITINKKIIGTSSDQWIEPFLIANRIAIRRLALREEIAISHEPVVRLHPGPFIGAMPLLHPTTRRVAAGLLVKPRFQWESLGAVYRSIGFSVEPLLGGAPLVPGSAREVPAWILAGPVIERISVMLKHRKRGFIERKEYRHAPRGHIEWGEWASTSLAKAKWSHFPCRYTEPDDDPVLMAAVRWTLRRLQEELSSVSWTLPARNLLHRATEILAEVGEGAIRKPRANWDWPGSSAWILEAIEAMGWVAEERGLGGQQTLDGLAWNLSIDDVWEAWVSSLSSVLAGSLGMVARPFRGARRFLRWTGNVQSMGMLIPDVEMRGIDHTIWIDAKYKAHLVQLQRKGWQGISEMMREGHRADLHQALAYATLSDAPLIDTLLVYPQVLLDQKPIRAVASVTSGRRRVRMILASLPFGFRTPDQQKQYLGSLRELFAS